MSVAKPKLVPEPKPETVRLQLDGDYAGQWVEVRRVPTVDEFLHLMSGSDPRAHVAIATMVVKHSFGGRFGAQSMPVLTAVLVAWTKQAEDAALDPKAEAD